MHVGNFDTRFGVWLSEITRVGLQFEEARERAESTIYVKRTAESKHSVLGA